MLSASLNKTLTSTARNVLLMWTDGMCVIFIDVRRPFATSGVAYDLMGCNTLISAEYVVPER